ncbi:MAG: hypothetical protein SVY41_00920, partial [Candidatus Nanohaloarchaea archaeon]|nr:hypothetical protein [Candidatus Nanohaloarchaea archaeon]
GSDNVLHVHAENVDLDYALRTLDISINRSCIRFRLENVTRCDAPQVGVTVNGEQMQIDAALDRDIKQGDSIVLWTGKQPPTGFDRKLPPAYREPVPGKSV